MATKQAQSIYLCVVSIDYDNTLSDEQFSLWLTHTPIRALDLTTVTKASNTLIEQANSLLRFSAGYSDYVSYSIVLSDKVIVAPIITTSLGYIDEDNLSMLYYRDSAHEWKTYHSNLAGKIYRTLRIS